MSKALAVFADPEGEMGLADVLRRTLVAERGTAFRARIRPIGEGRLFGR